MRSVFSVILAGIILFSGCKNFEAKPEISLPLKIPDSFSIGAGKSDVVGDWWLAFNSEELNVLIEEAKNASFDLKILRTRIAQAKARVAKQDASFSPGLGFSIGGQKTGIKVKKTRESNSFYDNSHSWDGSLSASYTADVWGEANAGKQVQVLSLGAANQELRLATLELTADIAETWIDIVSIRNRLSILDNQIKINKTLLELQKLRFINGKATALDVSQQRQAMAEANSQVPLLEKQEKLLLNHLAFLSGKTPMDVVKVQTKILPDPLPLSRAGIPSDLLENRPDIQAAFMRLSSSQWGVEAARADLLPSFKLTAQALFSSGKLDLLFQNWVAALAGSIAGPIFDGGFRKAEVIRVKAFAEEQLNIYAKTVSKAIREVEDSLSIIQKQEDYIKLLEEELGVVRITLKDAMLQYQNGQSSYLSYLMAWTSIERLERQLVGERATLMKERIKLYQALGWKPEQKT